MLHAELQQREFFPQLSSATDTRLVERHTSKRLMVLQRAYGDLRDEELSSSYVREPSSSQDQSGNLLRFQDCDALKFRAGNEDTQSAMQALEVKSARNCS
ncbi:hypothetical protein WJX77_001197 [Trebouxia sp. C0004]